MFAPTLACLLLWGLYTGALQRWASKWWRRAGITALIGAALFIGGCAIKILIVIARLLY